MQKKGVWRKVLTFSASFWHAIQVFYVQCKIFACGIRFWQGTVQTCTMSKEFSASSAWCKHSSAQSMQPTGNAKINITKKFKSFVFISSCPYCSKPK